MEALEFWKAVTVDRTDFLERIIQLLQKSNVRFCVVGGLAVNAYAEPVVTIDFDLAVAVEDLARAESLLRREFRSTRIPSWSERFCARIRSASSAPTRPALF